MKTDSAGLIETLRKTSRCRSEVSKAAESFVELPPDRCESLLKRLIDAGEGCALGILLIICGVHGVKLDPTLLAGALKVVESLEDFSFPYIAQDLAAVDPLLQLARSRDITLEHRIFAARLAAELTVRLGGDRGPVKKVLQRMATVPLHPGLQLMNSLSLELLDLELEEAADFPWETQKDVMSALPEEKPPVIIGGGYTVRRPVPKLGRNAPCHCGSGRKYKKCCHDKDRKLLRDASPYEGVTMTQARTTPGLVDGGEIIHGMKAFELKKLTPSKLNEEQLLAAFKRANLFRLNEVALAMLLELKGRGRNADDTITPLLVDLLDSALHAKDLELAKRIRRHIPGEAFPDEAAIRFHMELLENREYFEGVEARCKEALTPETGEETFELDPLLVLGYDCENLFPALSVVFSRAAIVGNPDREFDNEFLLEVIRGARADLDLEPWSDPVEEYVQWSRERNEEDSE
ncbi:MAG: hypothetical protein GY859_00060, partial [Desulfobacterales bacterium]|nr:hypothetical protein [Desulfobacterales bacterium]